MNVQHGRVAFALLESGREYDKGFQYRAVLDRVAVLLDDTGLRARQQFPIDGRERLQASLLEAVHLGRRPGTGNDGEQPAVVRCIELGDDVLAGNDPLRCTGGDIDPDEWLLAAVLGNGEDAPAVRRVADVQRLNLGE